MRTARSIGLDVIRTKRCRGSGTGSDLLMNAIERASAEEVTVSTRSVAEKLSIRPDTTVWSSHASHLGLIEPLPDRVRQVHSPDQAATAVVFAPDAGSLRRILAAQRAQLGSSATAWVAYPKANRADIDRDTLWPILVEYGMRPTGQVSVDEFWSAMRFRANKPGEAPFAAGTSASDRR
jgi:hypothetical protein